MAYNKLILVAVAIILAAGSTSAFYNSIFDSPPVWCWREANDECRLFLGTEQSCKNASPCLNFRSADLALTPTGAPKIITPELRGLEFCMGWVEGKGCMVFLGTEESCRNIKPCFARAEIDLNYYIGKDTEC